MPTDKEKREITAGTTAAATGGAAAGAATGAAIGAPAATATFGMSVLAGALIGAIVGGFGGGVSAQAATTTKADDTKQALKEETGYTNIKKAQKAEQRQAYLDSQKLEKKAERQEERLRDPEYMSERMGDARKTAIADFARAPTGGQQADLARAAMGGADARRVAEVARQASRGQQEAQSQAAVAGGQQAAQQVMSAEQAMAQQLRQREAAKMAQFMGAPPVTFGEQLGQQTAGQLTEGGIKGAQVAGAGALYGTLGDETQEGIGAVTGSQQGLTPAEIAAFRAQQTG